MLTLAKMQNDSTLMWKSSKSEAGAFWKLFKLLIFTHDSVYRCSGPEVECQYVAVNDPTTGPEHPITFGQGSLNPQNYEHVPRLP